MSQQQYEKPIKTHTRNNPQIKKKYEITQDIYELLSPQDTYFVHKIIMCIYSNIVTENTI